MLLVVIFSFVDDFLIAFGHHSSPFHGLSPGFLHPILYSQPSPLQSDSRHFRLFNHSVLAASAAALSGHFLPIGIFLPYALSQHFWHFIKASLGASSYSFKFSGLHTDPQNTDPAHLLV